MSDWPTIQPILPEPATGLGARPVNRPGADRAFDRALAQAERTGDAALTRDEARAAAEELVSIVLVQPLLEQIRESNQAWGPFAPSSGEKQFQALLDAEIAQELTRATRFPLVERLARDLRGASGTDATSTLAVTA